MTDTLAPETETTATLRTFRVHEDHLDTARALVAKVNRKAARYGLTGYELVIGELTLTAVHPVIGGFLDTAITLGYEGHYTVELTGTMPQIDGWAFVATLDYEEEAGVITRVVPGVDVDLAAHRPRPAECDHCHKARNRNNTYVLRNTTGETMQVGGTCLQPYMGFTVAGLNWLAGDPLAELSELGGEEREEGYSGWGGYSAQRFDVDGVLIATMAVEQVDGWTSRATAEAYGKTATSALVMDYLNPTCKAAREYAAHLAATADWTAAKAKADTVRAWVPTMDGDSEYATNLRTLAAGQTVTRRNVGLLASAVACYNRAEGLRIEREQTVPAEWIGEPKQRLTITGKVVRTTRIDGFYGTTELVLIRTETALIKWFASSVTGFEVGDTVTGKATVKAHETYQGDKQTTVTRCALETVTAP